MTEPRLRCGSCGRSRPESETTLISGHRQGDYRRASRPSRRRVCRDCTVHRIEFARDQHAKKLSTGVNEHAFSWDEAARYFGLDISGLLIDRMTGRRA